MGLIPLALASNNPGKLRELRQLLREFPVDIKSLAEFPSLPLVDEDGDTFEDNAVKKARFYARLLGIPALADDSGLEVYALGGAPGVRSARYAGDAADDDDNNRKLLSELHGVDDRRAAFVCVLAIAVPWGPALVFQGRCEGTITTEPRGRGGFGYDPVFYFPPLGKTFAELTPAEKNRVSHRGKALEELRSDFPSVLQWLRQRLAEAGWSSPEHA